MILINTEGLQLRDFALNDWEQLAWGIDDPFSPEGPSCQADLKAFVHRQIESQGETPRTEYRLAVVLAETQRIVGIVGLDLEAGEAWISYHVDPLMRGQGIATRAGRAMIRFGFDRLGLPHISGSVDPTNGPSKTVLVKLGMSYQDTRSFPRGEGEEIRDVYVLAKA
jgi:RimJ/RimL family protein N-acetyltransferase